MSGPKKVPFPRLLLKPDRATFRQKADERRARPDLAEIQDRSGHGNRSTYTYWFCRCKFCTRANSRYVKYTRLIKELNK